MLNNPFGSGEEILSVLLLIVWTHKKVSSLPSKCCFQFSSRSIWLIPRKWEDTYYFSGCFCYKCSLWLTSWGCAVQRSHKQSQLQSLHIILAFDLGYIWLFWLCTCIFFNLMLKLICTSTDSWIFYESLKSALKGCVSHEYCVSLNVSCMPFEANMWFVMFWAI